jgi:homoserine dehydrogenase
LVKSQPATTATTAPFYLRLQLLDKPGALAKVASVMGDAGVSIDRMRQYGHDAEQAPVLIVTHKTTRAAIDQILEDFAKTRVVEGQPVALRIEAV